MSLLLLIATANSLLEVLAPIIIKFVTELIGGENAADRSLRKDLHDIKDEMGRVSMVDEFAKYAKLQRKYNKLEGELKSKVNTRMMSRIKLRLGATYSFKILNAVAAAIMLYLHRSEPVAILPKDALWPFNNLLSWPCSLDNSISLTMWILISRLALSGIK